MRSELRFVMHPGDELEFLEELLRAESLVLLPHNQSPWDSPPIARAEQLDHWGYFIVGPADERNASKRSRNRVPGVQILRSMMRTSTRLTDGRIALVTHGFGIEDEIEADYARALELRFKRLSRWIKKRYSNRLLQWLNPKAPEGPTNPTKPDSGLWVGRHAVAFVRGGGVIVSSVGSIVETRMVDAVE